MAKEFHEISHICSEDDYLSLPGHNISSELYLYAIFSKNHHFLPKKVFLIFSARIRQK